MVIYQCKSIVLFSQIEVCIKVYALSLSPSLSHIFHHHYFFSTAVTNLAYSSGFKISAVVNNGSKSLSLPAQQNKCRIWTISNQFVRREFSKTTSVKRNPYISTVLFHFIFLRLKFSKFMSLRFLFAWLIN